MYMMNERHVGQGASDAVHNMLMLNTADNLHTTSNQYNSINASIYLSAISLYSVNVIPNHASRMFRITFQSRPSKKEALLHFRTDLTSSLHHRFMILTELNPLLFQNRFLSFILSLALYLIRVVINVKLTRTTALPF